MDTYELHAVLNPAPADWTPLLELPIMRQVARAAARRVAARGHRPVAATVTGSRLRGVDHQASDVDVLVLVADKHHRATSLRPWICPITEVETEGQTQSLDKFVQLLSRSVPYSEALASPVLVADPAYTPLLQNLRADPYQQASHAVRFAFHAATRAQCPAHKAANHAHAAYAVAHGLPALLNRDAAEPGSPRSLGVAVWLEEYARRRTAQDRDRRGLDRPHDLPRAMAVVDHLRALS